jgi:hypothetical protein
MADTIDSIPTPVPAGTTTPTGSDFLSDTNSVAPSQDALYQDLFQDNGTGDITIGAKVERSGLEVFVNIIQYVTILVVTGGVLFGLHVFIRSIQTGSFLENYTVLCPYLNYDIMTPVWENKGCKSIETLKKEYTDKKNILEENIISALTEYIPIKVSANILDASPEKAFVVDAFAKKPHVDLVLDAFETTRRSAQVSGRDNIRCSGITITRGYSLSTQCTVYGGLIGESSSDAQIRSSRIEALQFLEKLGDTSTSSLILENPPMTLGIEKLDQKSQDSFGFSTSTTFPIQVRYIPLVQKI